MPSKNVSRKPRTVYRRNTLSREWMPPNPALYDGRTERARRELLRIAVRLHMELEREGLSPRNVARVARTLGRLAETVAGGQN